MLRYSATVFFDVVKNNSPSNLIEVKVYMLEALDEQAAIKCAEVLATDSEIKYKNFDDDYVQIKFSAVKNIQEIQKIAGQNVFEIVSWVVEKDKFSI